jgi:predicted ATPase
MMGGPARSVPFISRVRLKNYKSIAECDVRLGPLTILIGPNGTGKSNFLDALAFLARAVATTPYEAIEERGGLSEILRRFPGPTESFSIEIEVTVPWGLGHEQPAAGMYGFEVGASRRQGARPFEVIREICVPPQGQRASPWQAQYGAVRVEPGDQPVAGVEPDRLYLPVAAAQLEVANPMGQVATASIPAPFTALFRGLSGMRFYNFGLDELRRPQLQSVGAALGHRGEHLADVLDALDEEQQGYKERLNAYLRAVVPDVTGIDSWFAGDRLGAGRYVMPMLRVPAGLAGKDILFGPNAMSDGTIRAAAVLAALFQPGARDGRIQLVGIEEPEIALHPAAAGVLFDALTEASEHVQVLATSQSPDLLDRDELDVSTVRAVSIEHGLTIIGEVDEASRRIVMDKLYTLGGLMRSNQISPEPGGNGDAPQPRA